MRCVLRASISLCLIAAFAGPAAAELTLQKFVVTTADPCPTPGSNPTTVTVNAGDMVTYCYVITNSYGATDTFGDPPITFSTHVLTDTQFGDLTSLIKDENGNTVGGSFDLQGATGEPCASNITEPSHFAYVETVQTITTNETNTATWSASDGTEKCLFCADQVTPCAFECAVPCDPQPTSSPEATAALSNEVQVFVNTPTSTPTSTPTETPTETPTPSNTPSQTPTVTPTGTPTPTTTPQALGELCIDPIECVSGFCASGVCCDQECDEPGRICNLAGSVGTCVDVAAVPTASSTGVVALCLVLAAIGAVFALVRRTA